MSVMKGQNYDELDMIYPLFKSPTLVLTSWWRGMYTYLYFTHVI